MDKELQSASYQTFLKSRREEIIERIHAAASRVHRDPREISLMAVSKTVDVPAVEAAWQVGYRIFGENRPQELKRKRAELSVDPAYKDMRFDMIGNLQTNKINQVIECNAALIHSVSSTHLADAISKRAVSHGVTLHILLEVNISGELSKSGFTPSELKEKITDLCALPSCVVDGLMTMAPAHSPQRARQTFSGLYELREELLKRCDSTLEVLSYGMSDDFEIAIEEGSTLLRLGRVVFDPKHTL